jgi:hypothetical protein
MTTAVPPVSLQINFAHSDLEEAVHVLPHQLRCWAGQVAEVVCVVDRAPRDPSGDAFLRLARLKEFLGSFRAEYPHLRVTDVDYSESAVGQISRMFYGGGRVPMRDYRGRAFYPYLYGLIAPRHDLLFHIDCDMIFGGGSQTWIREGLEILRERADILACNPLPGPPRADGRLLSQKVSPIEDPRAPGHYLFPSFTTRLYLLSREQLVDKLGGLERVLAPPKAALGALLAGRMPYDGVERAISRAMRRRKVYRLDFLGRSPGMWAVHPLYRTPEYVEIVPEVIRMAESGDVPDAQRGEYDLTGSMLDAAARAAQPA